MLIGDLSYVSDESNIVIGPETHLFFDLGFNSLSLIRLKRRLEHRMRVDVPIIIFMQNPILRQLAVVLGDLRGNTQSEQIQPTRIKAVTSYNPVVPLHESGSKAPLWLVHPGVGEVLVFLGLVAHLGDDERHCICFASTWI